VGGGEKEVFFRPKKNTTLRTKGEKKVAKKRTYRGGMELLGRKRGKKKVKKTTNVNNDESPQSNGGSLFQGKVIPWSKW